MKVKRIRNRGQTMVFMALAMAVFLGFVALAIDGSMLLTTRRRGQVSADAAALAAANARAQGKTQQEATQIALEVAKRDGFDPNRGSFQVNYETRDDSEYIHVTITSEGRTAFAQFVYKDALRTTVESVARVKVNRTPLYNGQAIVTLSPHDRASLFVGGAARLYTHNSGIFVNSDAHRSNSFFGGCMSGAVQINGAALVHFDTEFNVVGDYLLNGAAIVEKGDEAWSGSVGMCGFLFGSPPPINTGVDPDPDVAAGNPPSWIEYIPPMPAPSCPSNTISQSRFVGAGPLTLHPGTYTKKVTIAGAGVITMEDGVYCFTKGVSINGAHLVKGDDVKWVVGDDDIDMRGGTTLQFGSLEVYSEDGDFHMVGGSHLDADRFRFTSSGEGNFIVAGASYFDSDNISLYLTKGIPTWAGAQAFTVKAPPPTDPYGGLFIYMPWENTSSFNLVGATYLQMQGSILAPHADINLIGGTVIQGIDSQIVSYTLHMGGASWLDIDFHEENQFGIPATVVELVK